MHFALPAGDQNQTKPLLLEGPKIYNAIRNIFLVKDRGPEKTLKGLRHA